jgi:uncharacterized protein (DUF433 family)
MIDWQKHIHSDRAILAGKPVIKNTRISVELVLELFATGWTEDMILESYPKLTTEDIKAVFAYLRDCVRQELYFPLPQATR